MNRAAIAMLILSVFSAGCSEGTDADTAVLVGKNIEVGTDWISVPSPAALRQSGPESEVWVEIPELAPPLNAAPAGLNMRDGTSRVLEIELTGPDKPTRLERISRVNTSNREFVVAMSSTLFASGPAFVGIRLRANGPVRVANLVWLSYDPSHFKAGIMTPPKALLER